MAYITYTYGLIIFIFIYVSRCLFVCICTMCVPGYVWKSEEEIGSPKLELYIGGCDQPYVGDGPSAIAASVFNC